MSDLNRVQILGRLARDPHFVPNSEDPRKNRAWLVIATGWTRGEETHTEYVNCNLWGIHADNAVRFLKKGDQVFVEGRLSRFTKQLMGDDGQPLMVSGKPVYQEQTTVNCTWCTYLQKSRKNQAATASAEDVDAAVQRALEQHGVQMPQAAAGEPEPNSKDPFDV